MRVLALDIGAVRTGIAISDPEERVATPLAEFSTPELLNKNQRFMRLLEDWEPELLLCGLPYTLAGEEGKQAASIREKAELLGSLYGLPVAFTDERLSSQEAKRSLREKGLDEKAMRGKIDMIAASIFLQAWLDRRQSIDGESSDWANGESSD